MSIYQSVKNFGKGLLLVGGLAAVLTGCFSDSPPEPSQNASSLNKILKLDGKTAILSTEVLLSHYNNGALDGTINGTILSLEIDGNKRVLLSTEDLITNIESGDLNNDNIDDFIVSFRMFDSYRRTVIGTRTETYLSTGKTTLNPVGAILGFNYIKK